MSLKSALGEHDTKLSSQTYPRHADSDLLMFGPVRATADGTLGFTAVVPPKLAGARLMALVLQLYNNANLTVGAVSLLVRSSGSGVVLAVSGMTAYPASGMTTKKTLSWSATTDAQNDTDETILKYDVAAADRYELSAWDVLVITVAFSGLSSTDVTINPGIEYERDMV